MNDVQVSNITLMKNYHHYFRQEGTRIIEDTRSFVLVGVGGNIDVQNDQLRIRQGKTLTDKPGEEYFFPRGQKKLERLIVLTNRYNLSGAAVEWLQDQTPPIPMIILNMVDKRVTRIEHSPLDHYPSYNGRDCEAYQRALSDARRLEIAKVLIEKKIIAQSRFVMANPTISNKRHILDVFDKLRADIQLALSVDEIRLIEASAASVYFNSLSELPLKWDTWSQARIPNEWLRVGERSSELSPYGNAYRAVLPFHACLNYLYAVLANRLLVWCIVWGLNPAIGVIHTPKSGRASLIYDLIEEWRPYVYGRLYDVLSGLQKGLHKGLFDVHRDGEIFPNQDFLFWLIGQCLPAEGDIERSVKQFCQAIRG